MAVAVAKAAAKAATKAVSSHAGMVIGIQLYIEATTKEDINPTHVYHTLINNFD